MSQSNLLLYNLTCSTLLGEVINSYSLTLSMPVLLLFVILGVLSYPFIEQSDFVWCMVQYFVVVIILYPLRCLYTNSNIDRVSASN